MEVETLRSFVQQKNPSFQPPPFTLSSFSSVNAISFTGFPFNGYFFSFFFLTGSDPGAGQSIGVARFSE